MEEENLVAAVGNALRNRWFWRRWILAELQMYSAAAGAATSGRLRVALFKTLQTHLVPIVMFAMWMLLSMLTMFITYSDEGIYQTYESSRVGQVLPQVGISVLFLLTWIISNRASTKTLMKTAQWLLVLAQICMLIALVLSVLTSVAVFMDSAVYFNWFTLSGMIAVLVALCSNSVMWIMFKWNESQMSVSRDLLGTPDVDADIGNADR